MKLNSKRSETESGTQLRSIRDQNDPSIGSKLEPFMKLNSKRSETESGMQPRSIRDKNDPSIGSKFEPFMKLNSKRSETDLECNHAAYATKMSHSCQDCLASFRLLPSFVPVATRFHSGNRPV